MPFPLHQSILSEMIMQIVDSLHGLPANLRRRIRVVPSERFWSFGGQWDGSQKEPDLSIWIRNTDNERELKWVLEVGFAESYEQLKNDVRLWLEGSSQVSMVTIAWFCEEPKYRCPVPKEIDPREVLGISKDCRDIRSRDVVVQGAYGPAFFKELQWVGEITGIYMESWVRDAKGKPRRRGLRKDLKLKREVQLNFGDILPPDFPQNVTIDLGDYHLDFVEHIRSLTVGRCADAVRRYDRRHGEESR
jgi:hypothetical protein